jgi:hypothetical protein
MTPRETCAVVLTIAIGTPLAVLALPYAVWTVAVLAALLGGL